MKKLFIGVILAFALLFGVAGLSAFASEALQSNITANTAVSAATDPRTERYRLELHANDNRETGFGDIAVSGMVGSVVMHPKYSTFSQAVELLKNRKGYIFGGWSSNPSCTDPAEALYPANHPEFQIGRGPGEWTGEWLYSDIILYAIWTPIEYELTSVGTEGGAAVSSASEKGTVKRGETNRLYTTGSLTGGSVLSWEAFGVDNDWHFISSLEYPDMFSLLTPDFITKYIDDEDKEIKFRAVLAADSITVTATTNAPNGSVHLSVNNSIGGAFGTGAEATQVVRNGTFDIVKLIVQPNDYYTVDTIFIDGTRVYNSADNRNLYSNETDAITLDEDSIGTDDAATIFVSFKAISYNVEIKTVLDGTGEVLATSASEGISIELLKNAVSIENGNNLITIRNKILGDNNRYNLVGYFGYGDIQFADQNGFSAMIVNQAFLDNYLSGDKITISAKYKRNNSLKVDYASAADELMGDFIVEYHKTTDPDNVWTVITNPSKPKYLEPTTSIRVTVDPSETNKLASEFEDELIAQGMETTTVNGDIVFVFSLGADKEFNIGFVRVEYTVLIQTVDESGDIFGASEINIREGDAIEPIEKIAVEGYNLIGYQLKKADGNIVDLTSETPEGFEIVAGIDSILDGAELDPEGKLINLTFEELTKYLNEDGEITLIQVFRQKALIAIEVNNDVATDVNKFELYINGVAQIPEGANTNEWTSVQISDAVNENISENATLKIVAIADDYYEFVDFTVNGEARTNASEPLEWEQPLAQGNNTIFLNFRAIEHDIVITKGIEETNGTLKTLVNGHELGSAEKVKIGDTLTIKFEPDKNYNAAGMKINGEEYDSSSVAIVLTKEKLDELFAGGGISFDIIPETTADKTMFILLIAAAVIVPLLLLACLILMIRMKSKKKAYKEALVRSRQGEGRINMGSMLSDLLNNKDNGGAN
ncbi:MAG: hypothetical protein LBM01_00490 [Christensenellaceae bacterium]|jgi:hypothetical protein|nr:hypothetical protein [Christensenellaceae bacterium]